MTEPFTLSRPVRLPKTTRIKNESFRVNNLRKSSKMRKMPVKRPTVSRFDRSACEEFIASNYENAVHAPYEAQFSFLNNLLELLQETSPDSLNSREFFESICSKVIVFIKDDFALLRAMSFRIIRLCLFTERHLTYLISVSHIDIYVVRGLDLRVENEVERIEALQLISHLILVYQSSNLKKLIESTKSQKNKQKYAFPRSVMQPVIAIALSAINITGVVDKSENGDNTNDQVQTSTGQHYHSDYDRLALPCIATFLEFCIYEPDHILNMAGTDWMVRVLTGTAKVSRRIASMVGRILVHWLDDPSVRLKAQLHLVLEQIFAPLIEFGFFQRNPATVDFGEKEVERIMSNFSYSFMCILRSWSGLIACSAVGSNSTIISSSPLRLLEYLGLGTVENSNLRKIRDIIVDICCDFMDLSYMNSRFTDWNKAVQFYASKTFPDSYESSLKEDFVLAQSDLIMRYSPEYCNHVDLLSSFRAFAFFVLINAGLPQALSRLIVAQPNAPSGIKATLLMADMLNTAPSVIPSSWSSSILSLPTLIQSACEALTNATANRERSENSENQGPKYTFINAQSAELVHHRFDVLNTISIQNASCTPSTDSNYALFMHSPRESSNSLSGWKNNRSDHQSLMENSWKGDNLNLKVVSLLFSSLLEDVDTARRVDKVENINAIFVKLLSEVSVTNASHPPWAPESNRILFVCARNAIIFSLQLCSDYPSIMQALEQYAQDFKVALDNLSQGTNIFSVKNLSYGGSMYIFALIGAYTSHQTGISILHSKGIFQHFIDMMNASIQTDYVKVIVSCLNYEYEGIARIVLQKSLTSTSEVARRWCTRFVGTLASLQLPGFGKWGMRLLLGQLADPCIKVVRHAIRLLHVWLPVYPEAVRFLRNTNLENFGEAGILLQAHVYSIEEFCLDDEESARNSISLWMTQLNERYIQMIDDEMRTSLLSVKRTLDGSFSRTSSERLEKFGIRCPVHLFGALARHPTGRHLLTDMQVVKNLMNHLDDDEELYKVKGALIALGHIGGAEDGISLFTSSTLSKILKLCEESPVLSVRGTAFWALNILGASLGGASALAKFGWESNRHRSVIEEVQLESERSSYRTNELRKGTLTPNIPEIISEEVTFTPCSVNKTRSRSNSDITSCVYSPGRVGMHKSRSETALSTLLEPQYSSLESISPEAGSRNERTLTGESAVTSALSSMMDDSSTSRRRATTTGSLGDEWETRSRSSTVAQYVSQTVGNERRVDIDPLSDITVEPHFSSRLRERHRLAPMPLRRCLQVNRNIGDPICYFFMTDTEEQNLSLYRHAAMEDTVTSPVLEWRCSEIEKVTPKMVNFHITALPIDVDVMCMNIFSPRSYHASIIDEMEDRGAKSGHGGRSQRTDADLTHSALRCFYCSANTEKYPLPNHVDVAGLRRRVLNHVDMLEIKEIGPEKKLLSLRAAHPWLFEWPCLYADVLELLDEYRFKARSRAFLQEIFYNALKL